jgi:hypothetical protein
MVLYLLQMSAHLHYAPMLKVHALLTYRYCVDGLSNESLLVVVLLVALAHSGGVDQCC